MFRKYARYLNSAVIPHSEKFFHSIFNQQLSQGMKIFFTLLLISSHPRSIKRYKKFDTWSASILKYNKFLFWKNIIIFSRGNFFSFGLGVLKCVRVIFKKVQKFFQRDQRVVVVGKIKLHSKILEIF